MSMQKIYKSPMPLVSFTCASLFLASSVCLIPDAVAKQVVGPVEKIQPLITLSQVQTLSPALIPSTPVAAVKTKPTNAKHASITTRGKKRTAPNDHYRSGLALKAKGNTNRALVEFLKATQKNPRQINAFYEQALIFRQQGYLKLADSSLQQALRIAKTTAKNANSNDLTRIRLLLATVRLEQGNIGSAAEELSRSLGINLTLPGNDKETNEIKSAQEQDSPTTILQLHPRIEESEPKKEKPSKVARVNEDDLWSEPADTKSNQPPNSDTRSEKEKETPADETVATLLKEGFAGLKDHLFNPLSILGIPHISMDSEKADKTAETKKGKQTRRSLWSEAKRRAAERAERAAQERKLALEKKQAESERNAEEKRLAQERRIAEAKALAEEKKLAAEQKLAELERLRAERKLEKEKRIAQAANAEAEKKAAKTKNRLSWFEKRLSPPAETNASNESNESNKKDQFEKKTQPDSKAEIAIAEPEEKESKPTDKAESDSDVAYTSKTAALTFTPEESANTERDSHTDSDSEFVEVGSFKLTMPPAITRKISLVAALLSAFNHEEKSSPTKAQTETPADPIDARLKYLAEHGTSSLKEGEAFMFSEESGEATLFMGNGEVIRRTIAIARGHEEVAKLRRPDILIPEELIYNLALMAKILPKQDEPKETEITAERKETAPTLKMPEILNKPHSFTDWLRDVLNL